MTVRPGICVYSGFWRFKHFQIIPYTFEAKSMSDVYIDFMEEANTVTTTRDISTSGTSA